MVLPLRLNPTAAAQGALALEVRRDRPELHKILSSLQGEAVATCIQKERDRLTGFGGGCHLKIGITRIERPYGQLEFVCGQTPEGEDLKELNYFPAFIAPEAAAGKTWPQSPKERGTSKRVALEVGPEQEYLDKGYNGLYVARTEALPSGWEPARFEWVWTAGLSTWRKLAEKGVWVHGSSESLGEKEDMRLGALSRAPLKWVKVTHAEAGPSRPEVLTLSTYEVQRKIPGESLKGRTHFYWRSGSEFLAARLAHPEIQEGYHFCGPGRTSEIVAKALGSSDRVYIHLEDFQTIAPEGEAT